MLYIEFFRNKICLNQPKALGTEFGLAKKIYQGQPRVIIYRTFIEQDPKMSCTKFQGNWSSGTGEGFFSFCFTYMCMAAILVGHVT